MEFEFKKFDHKLDLEKQRSLFEECFPETIGTTIISRDHYMWKFHSKKGEFYSSEYIVNEGKDMIGYYAALPYYYKFQDIKIRVAMVCDVMTGIKARGKGVFTKLGAYSTSEMAKEGFDITTGYPIRPEVIPGHMKVGWDKTLELPLYGRFIRFNSFLKNKKLSYLTPLINMGYNFFTVFAKSNSSKLKTNRYYSDEIDKIDGLSQFYEKWQTEVPISLVKDNSFLKWRLGAPGQKYVILVMKEDINIVGVLIAREFQRENIPCMGILDISIIKGYHSQSNILINELISYSKSRGLELILVMMNNFWYQLYQLKKSLFLKTPYKFLFITKNLSHKIEKEIIDKVSNWHVMWLDSDNL